MDGEFGVTFPTNHVELESPQINGMVGYSSSPNMFGSLPTVPEPEDTEMQ